MGVTGLDFGSVDLLRSIAINPAHQGKGIAAQLIDSLLATATESHLKELYLVTTADGYFTRYGFVPVSRETVPEAIQQTQQFSGLITQRPSKLKTDIALFPPFTST